MKIELFMRCTENRVEDDYDGGLVLLQAIKGQRPEIAPDILDSRLVLSAAHDPFMRQFPVTRDEKQARHFKITIEEVPVSDVPADPNASPELYNRDGMRVDATGRPLGFDRTTGEPR